MKQSKIKRREKQTRKEARIQRNKNRKKDKDENLTH